MSELRITNLTEDLAPQCAALELAAFPHADPEDLLSEEDIRAYARTFPEGFFVVMDGDRVAGQGAGIYLDFDFDHPQHTIREITGEHQCGNHDPKGAWYYGTDLAVHPDYRRRGLGHWLYEVRKDLVRQNNKRGIIAGGHMPGYSAHKGQISTNEYLERVAAGELYDSTLSFQMENGFRVVTILKNYIRDEVTDGDSVLIVWDNPDFRPT
ncbi:MAG TPA: GNAT family N-acetyltransferase [Acidimicrobiia bacterium]|jgi:GNAT superfamily N-acetyltransferase